MKWFKDNWLILLIVGVVALIAWQQLHSDSLYDKLMEDYNAQGQAHEAELKALENVNTAWRLEQEKLNKKYQADLEQVETNFNQRLDDIAEQRKKDRRRIVRAARKDPTTLTRAVQRVFGIPVYGESKK